LADTTRSNEWKEKCFLPPSQHPKGTGYTSIKGFWGETKEKGGLDFGCYFLIHRQMVGVIARKNT